MSAVGQEYAHKFIAVLDDGSIDGSYETIKEMIDPHEITDFPEAYTGTIDHVPVLLIRNEKPTGPSAARNKLIKACGNQGHVFAPLDADDQFMPGKLSKCVAKMIKGPKTIGLVYTDHMIHNVERNTTTYESREPYDRNKLQRENIISNSPVINGLVFEKVGLYDEDLRTCEDWDFYLRITEHFYAIHIPEPLQVYTVTGFNATVTVDDAVWNNNWRRVQQKLQQRNSHA